MARFALVPDLARKLTVTIDASEVEPPFAVAICSYPGEAASYLFHCSQDWLVLAAGHYPSEAAAVASAESAYPGVAERWSRGA